MTSLDSLEEQTISSSTSTISTAVDTTQEVDERRQYGLADVHTTLGMGIKRSTSNITGYVDTACML